MTTALTCHPSMETTPDEREILSRRLFERAPLDLSALLEQGPWNPAPPHPSPEELLTPLAHGLKSFQISCW
ncbi:MAG: hypothetical protein HQL86_09810 [Magnetococcales bacterium]|nr:hypothetical protein [Magnetococcales bacterium]